MRLVCSVLVAGFVAFASAAPSARPAQDPADIDALASSVRALASSTTPAGARWQQFAQAHPQAVLRAISAAQARGWKATASTGRAAKGDPGGPVSRLVQNGGVATGDGEMLVWDWDDGNPSTGEGTIYVKSYRTGNEMLFNVQISGDTYDSSEVTFHESVWTAFNASPVAFPGSPDTAPRVQLVGQRDRCESIRRMCEDRVARTKENLCRSNGIDAGGGCLGRSTREKLREGYRSAAASAIVGFAAGAWSGGLAPGLLGAAVGAGPGFAAGVLYAMIWGTDYDCTGEARTAYNSCMSSNEWNDLGTCMWASGGGDCR
jgi:hypothetical protein